MKHVQQNLKVAQDMQKSYAGLKRTPREFQVGEHLYIKVHPKKISLRMGKYSKLAPMYCGPFGILDKVWSFAYRLSPPPTIKVHNVFHIFYFEKIYS